VATQYVQGRVYYGRSRPDPGCARNNLNKNSKHFTPTHSTVSCNNITQTTKNTINYKPSELLLRCLSSTPTYQIWTLWLNTGERKFKSRSQKPGHVPFDLVFACHHQSYSSYGWCTPNFITHPAALQRCLTDQFLHRDTLLTNFSIEISDIKNRWHRPWPTELSLSLNSHGPITTTVNF